MKSAHLTGANAIYILIPLPVPNWASAEEQFIPNYPPQITIYSKFFFENPNFSLSTKFFLLDLSVGVLNSDLASSYFPLKIGEMLVADGKEVPYSHNIIPQRRPKIVPGS